MSAPNHLGNANANLNDRRALADTMLAIANIEIEIMLNASVEMKEMLITRRMQYLEDKHILERAIAAQISFPTVY